MLPCYVRILGIDHEVEENETIGAFEQPGVANCPHHKIMVAYELPDEAKVAVLLHECIEAINYQLQVGLKHRQITALGTAINQLLVDNPSFVELFIEDETEVDG